MDIYISMCREAQQLQKEWRPQLGDWFYSKEVDDTVIILGFTKESRRVIDKGIWLPTEEQLQGIAMTLDSLQGRVMQPFWELADQFNYFIFGDETRKYVSQFNSFKEFWFTFVMKEKYHKMWDGKTWIKEEGLKC